jgi:nitrate reductase gamma subunit
MVKMVLGMISIFITAGSSIENYAELGTWVQKVITFQPDAGAVIAGIV